MALEEYKPRLYATEETRRDLAELGVLLPDWAGMDVLAIGQEDIKLSPHERNKQKVLEAFHQFAAPIKGFPFRRFYNRWDVVAVTQQARAAVPHGYPVSARKLEERNVCAIILPSQLVSDPRKLASRIVGLDYDVIENLPGTARDWQALILAHEARHCAHEDLHRDHDVLYQEFEADRHGLQNFRTFAKNDELAGQMGQALVSLRAVGAFLSSHNGHVTGALLATANGQIEVEPYLDALKKVRRKIGRHTGHKRGQPGQIYQAAKVLHDTGALNHRPLEKLYVRQFLQGAETFFPTYFGI